jgi:hypothetical protein
MNTIEKKKHFRQCSKCGKFSTNRIGEYIRKDKTCGYINQQEDESGPICDDCREKEENDCQ